MTDTAASGEARRRANGGANGHTLPFGQYERLLALRYLFATRKDGGVALMSIIAFVGVMLAVAALISVMSIMSGFRYELLSRMLGINGDIYVQSQLEPMTLDTAQAVSETIRAMRGVEDAYPLVAAEGLATGPNGARTLGMVRAMAPEDMARIDFITEGLAFGGSPEFGAGNNGGDIVYVGEGLAQLLNVGIGDQLTLIGPDGAQTPFGSQPRRKAYTVGDFIDTGLEDYNRVLIYMPLNQAQLFFNRGGAVDQIEIRVPDPDSVETLRPLIQRQLGAEYLVTDWRDRNAALFNALQVERGAMRLILMIVVLIAALNIISGFTMLVRAKSRDIAILRTVGVDRGSVLRVFLMSGAMLGAAGTIAGIVAGVLFCTYIGPIQNAVEAVCRCQVFAADVYGLDHLPARLDWNEVRIISLWGFGVSVFVTLIPAWFAARLDPVEALRYE